MVSYLTTLFLGKSPEVNLPVHVLSAHFSPVTGSLLFFKQLIPKREIDTSDTYFHEGHFKNMKNNRTLKLNLCCLNMCSQGNMLCIA